MSTIFPLLASGQSSTIHQLTPTTIIKLPHISHPIHGTTTLEIEHEKRIYDFLASKDKNNKYILTYESTLLHNGLVLTFLPLGSLRLFIHGPNDRGRSLSSPDPTDINNLEILEQKKLLWAQQIAEGLKFLHDNGVIHCDLSTANTLITNDLDVVLCDFSSSMLDGQRPNRKNQCSRWYKRAPYSAPPNTILLPGEIGPEFSKQDDIWALGTILYELFCRKRMWGHLKQEMRVGMYWGRKWPETEEAGELGKKIRLCWYDFCGVEDVIEKLGRMRWRERGRRGRGVVLEDGDEEVRDVERLRAVGDKEWIHEI